MGTYRKKPIHFTELWTYTFKRKPALLSGIYFEIYLNYKLLFKIEISLDKLDPASSMLLSTYQLSVPIESSAPLCLGSFIPPHSRYPFLPSLCRWNQLVLQHSLGFFCWLQAGQWCYLRGACSYRLFITSRPIFYHIFFMIFFPLQIGLIQQNNHIHNFKHFYSSSVFKFILILSIKTKGKTDLV